MARLTAMQRQLCKETPTSCSSTHNLPCSFVGACNLQDGLRVGLYLHKTVNPAQRHRLNQDMRFWVYHPRFSANRPYIAPRFAQRQLGNQFSLANAFQIRVLTYGHYAENITIDGGCVLASNLVDLVSQLWPWSV